MSDNNTGVNGDNTFCASDIYPRSVVLNFNNNIATLAYSDEEKKGDKRVIRKPFVDVFSNITSEILSRTSTMLLPTGCLYSTKINSTKDAFLMQELPGVRTFRLTNRTGVKNLVSKMYNRFNAQTRVLEMNDVSPEQKDEVEKQINLRTQYMKSLEKQMLLTSSNEQYKLNFRVHFPYTYILIMIERKKSQRGVEETRISKMKASIALEPINSFNDYLYQFPLSNVSFGGDVCTGKMPLGNYGLINIKKYVEKMTGYFWNNKFNADIIAGPETYGNINFLGNWFEWEFNSYVNPEKIFSLKLDEESIISRRVSVAAFIYDKNSHSDASKNQDYSNPVNSINAFTIADGFTGKDKYGDALVDLENGNAQKNIRGIADTIHISGHDIVVGSLLKTKTEKDKKFKIISFDGVKTYTVDDSTLIEQDSSITHVQIKDTKKRIHRFKLNKTGINFLVDSYRKAKNYVLNAVLGEMNFKIGDVITTNYQENEITKFDMIKTIREKHGCYVFEFFNTDPLHVDMNNTNPDIRKVEVLFTFNSQKENDDGGDNIPQIESEAPFSFRRRKLHKLSSAPPPFSICDHVSEIITGTAAITNISMKKRNKSRSNWQTVNRNELHVEYCFTPSDCDSNSLVLTLDDLIRVIDHDKGIYRLLTPLPDYIVGVQPASVGTETTIPTIRESETVIAGQRVCQAISRNEIETEVPFKIIRDGDSVSLSTVKIKQELEDEMFFYPAAHHLKSCVAEVDGIKTFAIRDLYETGTDKEYINFKVGDEIMLTSDWDSRNDTLPSIKKIYDFITVVDKYPHMGLETPTEYHTTQEEDDIRRSQFDAYSYDRTTNTNMSIEFSDDRSGISGEMGTLYAVVDDGSENLIFHPMISSTGQHFLNSMSHIIKKVDNLQSGDFIKSKIGGIPYFPKSAVDEVVCSIKFNNRNLTILKSGYTMWTDIILNSFKIFKRSKLTASKIDFYIEKTRLFTPDMKKNFMVIYGDSTVSRINIPLLTKDEITDHIIENPPEARTNFMTNIFSDLICHTSNIDKTSYINMLDDHEYLYTFNGFNANMTQKMVVDCHYSSFRSMFDNNLGLGGILANQFISLRRPDHRFYDMSYSLINTSLKNGSAYLDMDTCLYGSMETYSYYNSPYLKSNSWVSRRSIVASLLTFPTPRILKKSTRDSESFKFFKYLGPQNIFYSDATNESTNRNRRMRGSSITKTPACAMTSDNIFPKEED